MYEALVESVRYLQKSKYGKGNKKTLASVMSALGQAKSLFPSDDSQTKQFSFRNIPVNEHIPTILEKFIDSFEKQCLQNNNSAKNYSLFFTLSLKIVKTMDNGKQRGLVSAHVLNKLNQMLAKHSISHSKQAINDPMGIIFALTELAIDVQKNLDKEYEFDQSILDNMAPFMQRYYEEYDFPIKKMLQKLSDMPKSRMTVKIGQKHQQILQVFLQHSVSMLSFESRVKRASYFLKRISEEEDDTVTLEYYNTLKLSYADTRIHSCLSKIAKELNAKKRFAKTILDEVSNM